MAKYLPQFGWEPIIYTPQNPELMTRDEELLKEVSPDLKVWKRPIFEPYFWYKIFTGKRKRAINPGFISDHVQNVSIKERIALFIRSNFFFPDPRCFWRRPSVRYLSKRLKTEPVDWIITTGPPQSMHLIGRDLRRKTNIPWLADFRDPWTGIYYFKHLRMTPLQVKRHKKAEQSVVREADIVTVVSPQMKRDFTSLQHTQIEVIPNGFDEDDFKVEPKNYDEKFAIIHTGLFTKDANPNQLWKALSSLANTTSDFRERLLIVLVGQTDGAVKESIEEVGLSSYTRFVGYVSHLEAVSYQKGADLLLLSLKKEPESKGIITGKLFEYLAAGKPVLGIGPVEGDLARILSQCNAGVMYEFEDFEGIKQYVKKHFNAFLRNSSIHAPLQEEIATYSRNNLCEKMAALLGKNR
jgi:glycosyltransferase involved in cell wall biosynthesis